MQKTSKGGQLLWRAALPLFFAGLPLSQAFAAPAPETFEVQQQEQVVQGSVKDSSGEPLIGVSIKIAGQKRAIAITDSKGNYRVTVPNRNVSLVFTYIGFSAETVAINGRSTVDVVLKDEDNALGTVVVTAMGIRRKESSLTYATQQVRAADLNRVQDPNVANSLEGKVSGVFVTPSAGGAGGASKIILRGNKSILGSSTPLIVVDGVPMTNNTRGQVSDGASLTYNAVSEGSDALSMINPDDIESINVLKGANAAALYGSAAANGVLMITTKRGREGRMQIDFTSNITFDTPLTTPKIQNIYGAAVNDATGQMGIYSWGGKLSERSGDQLLVNTQLDNTKFNGQTNTIHLRNSAGDDLDEFYQTGVTTNNSIALSGGTEKVQTYFSYANSHANGMLENNKYNRHTFAFRQNFKFFDRIKIDVAMNYITTDTRNRPGGGVALNPIYHMYTMPRNIDIDYYRNNYVTQDGKWNSEPQRVYQRNTSGPGYIYTSQSVALTGPMQNWAYMEGNQNNPYWLLNQNSSRQRESRFFGNITGTVDIWNGFSFQARLGLDYTKYESESKQYATTWLPTAMNDFGRYWWSYERTREIYTDYMLNYNNKFGDFDVSASAGWVGHVTKGSAHSTDVTATYVFANQQEISDVINWFSTSAGGSGATSASNSSYWDKAALFTAQLGWKESVYIDGSYRRDWYRVFRQFKSKGTPEDYGYFGVGGNAIISNLVKLPKWFNYMKYRISYSEVGNSLPNVVYAAATKNYRTGAITVPPFADFENPIPETTRSFETGLEMFFLDSRLSVDLTYYNSTMDHLYLTYSNASGKIIPTNSAKIRNQGVEASVGYEFRFGPVTWKSAFNMAYNKNKILKTATDENGQPVVISSDLAGVRVVYEEGGAVGDMYVTELMRYTADDAEVKSGEMQAGWYRLSSTGGVQMETASDKKYTKYVGNMNAKWQLGWTNTVHFKDFTLSILINGRIGGKVISLTEAYLDGFGLSERTANARLYAEQNGIYATNYGENVLGMVLDDGSGRVVPIEAYYSSVGGTAPNDISRYIYNGTNFRLRELSLGYTFRDLLGEGKNLTLSFIGRNLFFFYKDAPVDPDISLSTSQGLGAYEVFNYPSSRSFGLSLKCNF